MQEGAVGAREDFIHEEEMMRVISDCGDCGGDIGVIVVVMEVVMDVTRGLWGR